jgi:hypothetical protein
MCSSGDCSIFCVAAVELTGASSSNFTESYRSVITIIDSSRPNLLYNFLCDKYTDGSRYKVASYTTTVNVINKTK